MSVEPQKFFIGVIDLFSVLLPGALVAFVLKDTWFAQSLVGSKPADTANFPLKITVGGAAATDIQMSASPNPVSSGGATTVTATMAARASASTTMTAASTADGITAIMTAVS